MRRYRAALLPALLLAGTPASAEVRVYSPGLTCAQVRAAVSRTGDVIVASSPTAYERVFRDGGACRDDVTGAPAFTPTADDPHCFAGYRCRQRSNGDGIR